MNCWCLSILRQRDDKKTDLRRGVMNFEAFSEKK
jgi:hypothetical protein